MLTKKFLVFARPLRCRLDRVQLLVRTTMKLHNMCIDERLGDQLGRGVHSTDITGDHTQTTPHCLSLPSCCLISQPGLAWQVHSTPISRSARRAGHVRSPT
jgi:hypothetical protein